MLREIRFVRQDNASLKRRWFEDEYFHLFVWVKVKRMDVVAFQLAYDRARHERAVSWSANEGFRHHRVDSGESTPFDQSTPLLIPDQACPIRVVARQFQLRSAHIEEGLREFILSKLRYGKRLPWLRKPRVTGPE
jgi:hypothetical protein